LVFDFVFPYISPFPTFLPLSEKARHCCASDAMTLAPVAEVVMSRLFRRKEAEKGEIVYRGEGE